ncbi:Capsule biosynthesis protein, PgsC/CapC [Romboutsia ilealis]|uniref:Capsule biosynthesis protein, PgsC/CapC n=1 Tax=Romboutsia ilealis TaxID=1115758 RepID=A0A1V1HYJ2_9FIRM|nr:poly-gamma-glutamate biosynthesis protein PgsC [Romboutsia ilealis]CED92969.1 Capsule biosynthesis protein, PgsC/CapC [Romboutsia ilealis]
MYLTDLYLSLILGLTIGLIFTEITGITPGGIIVPGYLALMLDQPITILIVASISMATFLIVKFILPKFIILYGRRRFVAVIFISVFLKLIFEYIYPILPFEIYEFRGIGVLVPALIANGFLKQGIKLTTVSAAAVTAPIFLIMNFLYIY